jgi:hypothetical protein
MTPRLSCDGRRIIALDVTHVLVIKDGADDPIDGILQSLANDPGIVTATPAPLDLAAGIAEARRRGTTLSVILIISREARIPAIVGEIRAVLPISTWSRWRSRPAPPICRCAIPISTNSTASFARSRAPIAASAGKRQAAAFHRAPAGE